MNRNVFSWSFALNVSTAYLVLEMHSKHFIINTICLLATLSVCRASEDQFYFVNNVDEKFDNVLVQPKLLQHFNQPYPKERAKREVPFNDAEEDIKLKLFSPTVTSLDVGNWILLLEQNSFISFGQDFEELWVSNDVDSKSQPSNDCKFFKGTVLYEPDSKAVMTVCDGRYYYGFFTTSGVSYFVEPTTQPVDGHIVYKARRISEETVEVPDGMRHGRSKRCTNCDEPEKFNLTGDTFLEDVNYNFTDEDSAEDAKVEESKDLNEKSDEEFEVVHEESVVRKFKKYDEDDVGYFADVAWEVRPYPCKFFNYIVTCKNSSLYCKWIM